MMRSFGVVTLLAGAMAVGCSARHAGFDGASTADLTGVTGAERGIHFESFVYVPANASDADIKVAIARQVKTALGALREPKVSLDDRGSQRNLDSATWTRTALDVVEPSNPATSLRQVVRVKFRYDDRAVVTNDLAQSSAIAFTLLADDYAQHDAPLKTDCTDDPTTDTDSLWYHYYPQSSACRARIVAELDAIGKEAQALGAAQGKVGAAEAGRWFIPVTARLDPPNLPPQAFSPEYDRLFGVGTDKAKLIVYAFNGVDTDENDPDDIFGQEEIKFLRAMLRAQPSFRPVQTSPFALLEDVYVDGKKLDGVTYEKMFAWIVDKAGYPSEVGADAAKIADLRRQAMAKFVERWVYWDFPVSVADSRGNTKTVTVEVRAFYGYEDGSPDARQHAQWRYLEALWYGDVFLYNGHSHFGHGPLEPNLYGPQNFNDRYQVMLVNSCISYNYYHEDFLRMKPGGTKNLDMVINGLPSYVQDSGVATARFLTGLIGGKQPTYVDLLNGMRLDFAWGETGYDPMRVVDGELDNVFSQSKTPLTLTVLPPVYP